MMVPDPAGSVLRAANLDATRRPDGIYVIQCPDGGCVMLGEDEGEDWWDFTAYGPNDETLCTDGAPTLDELIPALRKWTGKGAP